MVIWINILQTELVVEIHFKSLVRAIGKVSITLDNNNAVFTDF